MSNNFLKKVLCRDRWQAPRLSIFGGVPAHDKARKIYCRQRNGCRSFSEAIQASRKELCRHTELMCELGVYSDEVGH